MIKRRCLLTCLFLLCLTGARAENTPARKGMTVWQHGEPSRVQIDIKGVATTVNHQYLVNSPHRCFPNSREHIIVSQKSTWRIAPVEGNNPSLEATAFHIAPDGKSTRLWTIRDNSDEGKLHCDYFETVWYGCCSAQPNHRLFNPRTGKLLMEYSNRLITVEVPNSPLKRFIGYKPSETIVLNPWEKHRLHIGTLTYASPDGILHRIAIRGVGKVDPKFEMGMAKILIRRGHPKQAMQNNTLTLWEIDGSKQPAQIGGFSVMLQFHGATIELPVRGDDFVIGQSRFSDHEIIRISK